MWPSISEKWTSESENWNLNLELAAWRLEIEARELEMVSWNAYPGRPGTRGRLLLLAWPRWGLGPIY